MAYNQFGQWAGPHQGYFNEAGEPIMDAAAARLEASLDEQSAYERQFDDDDFYDQYEYDEEDPADDEDDDE